MATVDLTVQDAGLFTGLDSVTWTAAGTTLTYTNDGLTTLLIQSGHSAVINVSITSNSDEDGLSKTITKVIPIGSTTPQTLYIPPLDKALFDTNGKVVVTLDVVTAVKAAAIKQKIKS